MTKIYVEVDIFVGKRLHPRTTLIHLVTLLKKDKKNQTKKKKKPS